MPVEGRIFAARRALFGAGGKVGIRSARNLLNSEFDVAHVEISQVGQANLKAAIGADCVSADAALKGADIVLRAVPDTAIKAVSHSIMDRVGPGAVVICLDAAGPFAGHLPERSDVTCFITHPCHPPIFNGKDTPEGRSDHFGGIAAKQGIVSALMQGPEAHFDLGEKVGQAIYAPVVRSHRVTVDRMAGPVGDRLRVPVGPHEHPRRRDQGVFSDACNLAIEFGKPVLLKDDWKRVFEPGEIAASIQRIT
jgi:hypothetical protein